MPSFSEDPYVKIGTLLFDRILVFLCDISLLMICLLGLCLFIFFYLYLRVRS